MLQQYKSILVPIDGSFEAELAFNKAIEVAKRNDSALHILHVIDTRAFQNVSSFDSEMVEEITTKAKKTINSYVKTATDAGIKEITSDIEYGAPKVIIATDYPKKVPVDLIMIGATGLNAVERLLIGSVTEYVTRTAKSDVLVVRTDLSNKTAKNTNKK